MQNAKYFMIKKGLLQPGHNQFVIKLSDGKEVDFVELLDEYLIENTKGRHDITISKEDIKRAINRGQMFIKKAVQNFQ